MMLPVRWTGRERGRSFVQRSAQVLLAQHDDMVRALAPLPSCQGPPNCKVSCPDRCQA